MTTKNAVGNSLTGSTGSGNFVGATSPTLVTPLLGTPTSVNLTNAVVESCQVTKSSTQSINDATITAVTWNTETWDNNTIHDTGSNTERLTATTAGIYLVACHITWASNDVGVRQSFLYKNNVFVTQVSISAADTTGSDGVDFIYVASLAANDYLEMRVYQNSTGALNVDTAATYFSMTKLGKIS